jgi:hypothetical protein
MVYITAYPVGATTIDDRINYYLRPPKIGDKAATREIYNTGNLIYKTSLPTFNSDLYPANTICLVKVSG